MSIATRLRTHPVVSAVVLQVVVAVLTIGGVLILGGAFPELPGYSVTGPSQSLVLVLVLAVLAVLAVAALGW
jgi:VIT1/CCC1 family predicted Fe2+/Mn2+ transporter